LISIKCFHWQKQRANAKVVAALTVIEHERISGRPSPAILVNSRTISLERAADNGMKTYLRRLLPRRKFNLTVPPHVCYVFHGCSCRSDADEPDDHCEVHGGGEYPPRCAVCGRIIRLPTHH